MCHVIDAFHWLRSFVFVLFQVLKILNFEKYEFSGGCLQFSYLAVRRLYQHINLTTVLDFSFLDYVTRYINCYLMSLLQVAALQTS